MGDTRARLTSVSLLLPLIAVVGLAAGCGDNTPSQSSNAGTTGHGGTGGAAGTGGTAGGSDAGAGTGGNAGTGGVAGAAGNAGTGGRAGAGGSAGTGGVAGQGVDAGFDSQPPIPCYTTTFTAPTNGATLTVANDTDHSCANGFQFTVTITSNAPNGTQVQLFDGTSLLKTSTVAAGAASFAVQLASSGTTQLSIQYPTTLACAVEANVTVTCPNSPPTCSISAPTISATHPDLNGVPAPVGDRTSSTGSTYQATFVVNTNAEDGQPVSLAVDNAATPSTIATISATASGGSATFGVPLAPDGTYEVIATCTNKNGITGTSTKSTFPVDTTPPNLTVNSPASGQFLGAGSGTFQVCAQTSSPDAVGLSSSLGTGAQQNLCVAQGGSAKSCVAVNQLNVGTCISVTCPGAAPFSLAVTLSDAAGNPTVQTLTGVSCASNLPSVQIISPLSDSLSFTDKAKHILSATAPVGVHDQDPATPGAQADVIACTDTAGTATLAVGHKGGALAQLGTATTVQAAVAGDNCPAGLGFVARFLGVTLPESNENPDGTLVAASEITVTVTSAVNTAAIGTSPPVDIWIDTVPPVLTFTAPPGLCGSFTQSATTVDQDVVFTADDDLVTVLVVNGASTTTFDTPAFIGGVATFSNVPFTAGQNDVSATEDDPAGNETSMTPVPCLVTIGSAPVVTFTTPVPSSLLCPATATDTDCIDDIDPATAGWQGNLSVTVTASGAAVPDGTSVTFTVGGTTLGVATTVGGIAQVNSVTIPEGVQTIVATTSSVPNAGVGVGTVNVTVDTSAPDAPTNLNALVLDRRKTSMQVTWTAPSDSNGNSVSGYQVRYAKVAITAANFDNAAVATTVAYTGSPASPGQLDGLTVSGLLIENGYFFAVKSTDIAGTVSPMVATNTAVTAHFNETSLTGTAGLSNEQFGVQLDGSGDLNGDGVSDILVGSSAGQHAYIFFGTAGTFSSSAPSVVFSGDATTTAFGRGVAIIGDIDNDSHEDIAISDTASTPPRVFIYKGRSSWPMTMTPANADYVITPDTTYNTSVFGISIARLGDFNGDGIDDFAIGASQYKNGTNNAGRVVIVLGKSGFGSLSLPDTTNTITIDGDASLTNELFGLRVLGLGRFYSVTTGTTLIVSAPSIASSANASQGHLYSFHGQTGTAGVIALASADSSIAGPSAKADIGAVLTNLGPMLSALPAVGSGNPLDSTSSAGIAGSAFVFNGNITSGPFVSRTSLSQVGVLRSGEAIVGGGISGRNASYSLLGDSRPDLVLCSQNGTTCQIIDGNIVLGLGAGPIDPTTIATATIAVPAGWANTGQGEGAMIPDVNGDGYPDFAIANAINPVPGIVAVYW